MPKPDRKPWSRWTSTETPFGLRSSIAIFACLPSASNFALAHCPMRVPAWKLSVAKVASAASGGSTGRVQGDDEHPGLLGLVQRRHDRLRVVRGDHEALGPGGDQVLDGLDLRLVVAVRLAGEGLQLNAGLIGGLLRALLHLHEERVGVGLGDQADDDLFTRRRGRPARAAGTRRAASTTGGEQEGGRQTGGDQGGAAAAGGDGVPHGWGLSSSSTGLCSGWVGADSSRWTGLTGEREARHKRLQQGLRTGGITVRQRSRP